MTTMKDVKRAVEELDNVQALLLEQGERIEELQLELNRYIGLFAEADNRIEELEPKLLELDRVNKIQADKLNYFRSL